MEQKIDIAVIGECLIELSANGSLADTSTLNKFFGSVGDVINQAIRPIMNNGIAGESTPITNWWENEDFKNLDSKDKEKYETYFKSFQTSFGGYLNGLTEDEQKEIFDDWRSRGDYSDDAVRGLANAKREVKRSQYITISPSATYSPDNTDEAITGTYHLVNGKLYKNQAKDLEDMGITVDPKAVYAKVDENGNPISDYSNLYLDETYASKDLKYKNDTEASFGPNYSKNLFKNRNGEEFLYFDGMYYEMDKAVSKVSTKNGEKYKIKGTALQAAQKGKTNINQGVWQVPPAYDPDSNFHLHPKGYSIVAYFNPETLEPDKDGKRPVENYLFEEDDWKIKGRDVDQYGNIMYKVCSSRAKDKPLASYEFPGHAREIWIAQKHMDWLNDIYKRKFKTGGLADFTGPAWLDGTKSRPELVLNQRDTQNFLQLKDVLASFMKNGTTVNNTSTGNINYEISINVEKMTSDYDVEQVAQKIKQIIVTDATYRNSNIINRLR